MATTADRNRGLDDYRDDLVARLGSGRRPYTSIRRFLLTGVPQRILLRLDSVLIAGLEIFAKKDRVPVSEWIERRILDSLLEPEMKILERIDSARRTRPHMTDEQIDACLVHGRQRFRVVLPRGERVVVVESVARRRRQLVYVCRGAWRKTPLELTRQNFLKCLD